MLGRAVTENHHIVPHIRTLLQALADFTEEENSHAALSIAKAIQHLHLKAAKTGSWIEIEGWRLTTVEAAAYALSSFDLDS